MHFQRYKLGRILRRQIPAEIEIFHQEQDDESSVPMDGLTGIFIEFPTDFDANLYDECDGDDETIRSDFVSALTLYSSDDHYDYDDEEPEQGSPRLPNPKQQQQHQYHRQHLDERHPVALVRSSARKPVSLLTGQVPVSLPSRAAATRDSSTAESSITESDPEIMTFEEQDWTGVRDEVVKCKRVQAEHLRHQDSGATVFDYLVLDLGPSLFMTLLGFVSMLVMLCITTVVEETVYLIRCLVQTTHLCVQACFQMTVLVLTPACRYIAVKSLWSTFDILARAGLLKVPSV